MIGCDGSWERCQVPNYFGWLRLHVGLPSSCLLFLGWIEFILCVVGGHRDVQERLTCGRCDWYVWRVFIFIHIWYACVFFCPSVASIVRTERVWTCLFSAEFFSHFCTKNLRGIVSRRFRVRDLIYHGAVCESEKVHQWSGDVAQPRRSGETSAQISFPGKVTANFQQFMFLFQLWSIFNNFNISVSTSIIIIK